MAKHRAKPSTSRARPFSKLVTIVTWIAGVLVALAVGFGMIDGTLTVPGVEPVVPIAGWVVVILTLVGLVLAIVDALR